MKDSQLQFDRTRHVLYSRACKKKILNKLTLHAPQQREQLWEHIQLQYADYLNSWSADLGGDKNFHNGPGGTYDCITLMAYYTVCREMTSLDELEEMEGALFLPHFRALGFVDANRPLIKKLMYRAFLRAKKQCDRWGDFEMAVEPYAADKPLSYTFTRCPVADFAREHGLLELMPALCNPDYTSMELLHARLVRKTTCANGSLCDYTICGDRDPYLKDHPEYRDEAGYRRNR